METLRHYRELSDFELPAEPGGVLMLARERAALEPSVAEVARDCPELAPALLGPDELRRVEPAVAPGLWGCRLETGYPVRPAAATRAFAQARLRRGRALPRGRDRLAVGDRRARPGRAGRRRAATRRCGARGGRAVDPRGDRPHTRLAADRAGLGSGGGRGDGRAAHARARAGRRGGRGRGRPRIDLQPGSGGGAGLGGIHVPPGGAGPARVGADAAPRRRALRARPAPREGGRSAGLRPPAVLRRPAAGGRGGGPGGPVDRGGPRALGHLRRPGHGPDRRRRAAGPGPRCRRRCRLRASSGAGASSLARPCS